MSKREKHDDKQIVACEVCLKEVPRDDASHPETAEYVAHFCGLECYEKWMSQDGQADTEAGQSAK